MKTHHIILDMLLFGLNLNYQKCHKKAVVSQHDLTLVRQSSYSYVLLPLATYKNESQDGKRKRREE